MKHKIGAEDRLEMVQLYRTQASSSDLSVHSLLRAVV